MAILSKACKPDNFESHNSLKLSFTNIEVSHSSFVDCESFLESNSSDILALCEADLDDSIDSGNFSVRDYFPLIQKDCSTHMHGLAVYVKQGLLFARDLSLEKSADSYLCFRLALLHSVSYLLFLYWSPSALCTVFDSVPSNKDEVLSINPSANVFVFGEFNVHHKDWLTYSGGTDQPGELCYNFSISTDFTQTVNFPTRISDCHSHSPALLDFFLLTLVFVLQWFPGDFAAAMVHRNHFLHLYQREKSCDSKVKFRQASNHCKKVLEAAKLAYANKTKESITFQKLGSRDFWWIANSVPNKGKSAIPPLLNGPEVLSFASDKAKLFAENSFAMNSNLDDSGISLPVFPSRANLKLHNISVTPKMVRKVVMNLDLSKVSGPECIPVVVLKNCEAELSYIIAEFFNKCLKESFFPNCWKVSSVVPIFKNTGERPTAKNYRPVILLSVVSKVFEKLVSNRIVDHLEKCLFFSDF